MPSREDFIEDLRGLATEKRKASVYDDVTYKCEHEDKKHDDTGFEGNDKEWDMSAFTEEEREVLPHNQTEFDALPGLLSSALGSEYNMSDEDVSGIFTTMLYMGWAYWMLQSREVPCQPIAGVRIAESKGINQEVFKDMAKMFNENLGKVIKRANLKPDQIEALKDMYGKK